MLKKSFRLCEAAGFDLPSGETVNNNITQHVIIIILGLDVKENANGAASGRPLAQM